jgi:hypothetical protein
MKQKYYPSDNNVRLKILTAKSLRVYWRYKQFSLVFGANSARGSANPSFPWGFGLHKSGVLQVRTRRT